MAIVKTSELTDAALDWVANVCEGFTPTISRNPFGYPVLLNGVSYSTCADEGMKLIEREINVIERDAPGQPWHAVKYDPSGNFSALTHVGWHAFGPTPLIAATRCYVAFRRGAEVEIPDELLAKRPPS